MESSLLCEKAPESTPVTRSDNLWLPNSACVFDELIQTAPVIRSASISPLTKISSIFEQPLQATPVFKLDSLSLLMESSLLCEKAPVSTPVTRSDNLRLPNSACVFDELMQTAPVISTPLSIIRSDVEDNSMVSPDGTFPGILNQSSTRDNYAGDHLPSGRFIVDLSFVIEQARELEQHILTCSVQGRLVFQKIMKTGLSATLHFVCSNKLCSTLAIINTEKENSKGGDQHYGNVRIHKPDVGEVEMKALKLNFKIAIIVKLVKKNSFLRKKNIY